MTSSDIVKDINGYQVQFGKQSDRVYLLDYLDEYPTTLINNIHILAKYHNYSKIIIKASPSIASRLIEEGYCQEGKIANYHLGDKNALFLVKYLNPKRQEYDHTPVDQVIAKTVDMTKTKLSELAPPYQIRRLNEEHLPQMAKLFKQVFPSYPFPIFDATYLKKTMADNCLYLGVFHLDVLVGISNCEIAPDHLVCEMTDFAILEQHRGHQLARHLLQTMEELLAKMNIKTVYTIARASSLAMNATFKKAGYSYGGTLINNTQISGAIESMNIYHKTLV